MNGRFVTIWLPDFKTDWLSVRDSELRKIPFVLAAPDHGRMIITATNQPARALGIEAGMVLADARAIFPPLRYKDDNPEFFSKLLERMAEWCVRFSPVVAVDGQDGIVLDALGCSHLWGGEEEYIHAIQSRLNRFGYQLRIAMADTIGAAWAHARFGKNGSIIEPGMQLTSLLVLPVTALRLEPDVVERLIKLGLRYIKELADIPRSALKRRFGEGLIRRINQAFGKEKEMMVPVQPPSPYIERLPCLEPICTATGIEIAIRRLLETICNRLKKEEKGIRQACFKGYRIDGKLEKIEIGTSRPSHNETHLFKLFELKLASIEPALGIELFTLESSLVEDLPAAQENIWSGGGGLENNAVAELLDRISNQLGSEHISRYLPDEHYWPERSIKKANQLQEKPGTAWRTDQPRPTQILLKPEPVQVTAPIPDYPPMLFRYRGRLHKIIKADGPERIEHEWWIEKGLHRDYYCVEDEEGKRYWLFRSGHYTSASSYQWFIHGFFA